MTTMYEMASEANSNETMSETDGDAARERVVTAQAKRLKMKVELIRFFEYFNYQILEPDHNTDSMIGV
jgi:hypothetical protein